MTASWAGKSDRKRMLATIEPVVSDGPVSVVAIGSYEISRSVFETIGRA